MSLELIAVWFLVSQHPGLNLLTVDAFCNSFAPRGQMLKERGEVVNLKRIVNQIRHSLISCARVTVPSNTTFRLYSIPLVFESLTENQSDALSCAIVEASHQLWIVNQQDREVFQSETSEVSHVFEELIAELLLCLIRNVCVELFR